MSFDDSIRRNSRLRKLYRSRALIKQGPDSYRARAQRAIAERKASMENDFEDAIDMRKDEAYG